MESLDTENTSSHQPEQRQATPVCRAEELPLGSSKTVELSEGRELALFNVEGDFYAVDNFCPHKGAPLSLGTLCEHIIECYWHGWQFDVRTGECLTVPESISTYEVVVEDGIVKVLE